MAVNDDSRFITAPAASRTDEPACTMQRTPDYALIIRATPRLDATTLQATVAAVALKLVLVPTLVVLDTGPLANTVDAHGLALGAVAALVRRAEVELRVVAPSTASMELLLRIGVLPARGRFTDVDTALRARP